MLCDRGVGLRYPSEMGRKSARTYSFCRLQGASRKYLKRFCLSRCWLRTSPFGPIFGRSRIMSNCNYNNVSVHDAIDNPKWKASQKIVSVARIATWKPFWTGRNLRDRASEFGVKIVRNLNTSIRIPLQRFSVIDLSRRTDDYTSHPVQPYAGRVHELLPMAIQLCHQRRTHHFDDWLHLSIESPAEPNQQEKHCPIAWQSIERVPMRAMTERQ